MSWNYRDPAGWKAATVRTRRNGQWIEVDSSGGRSDGTYPSRFYTDGPPTRSGDTITYDGTNFDSLQAAHDVLEPGDTLYIDPANGPYIERLEISTSNITIESDGEISFDNEANPTVTSDGAVIEMPSDSPDHAVEISEVPTWSADASLASAVSGGGAQEDGKTDEVGDEWIDVTDASPFSVDDDIYIREDRVPYGEVGASGGSGHPQVTQEYRTVVEVDTTDDQLRVNHPIHLPYPNNNSTEVGVIDWNIQDVRLTGLVVRGIRSSSENTRPLQLWGCRDMWVDNTIVEQAAHHCCHFGYGYRTRFDRCIARHGNRYGFCGVQSQTNTMMTNMYAHDINRYVLRLAGTNSSSPGAVDLYSDSVRGDTFTDENPVVVSHFGGFYLDQHNVWAPDEQLTRFRSYYQTVDGFEVDGGIQPTIQTAQRPFNCAVRNGTIINKGGGLVFHFRHSTSTDHSAYGNERAGNLIFENIDIEAYARRDITEIGGFNSDECYINGLTFRNVTYDGQQLTKSDVTSWDGYNPDTITNLVVE